MTVSEYFESCDVEARKLYRVVIKQENVILTGVQCDKRYTLCMDDIDDALTDFDCQFNCDENGKLNKSSIYSYMVDHEDITKTRELTLSVKSVE